MKAEDLRIGNLVTHPEHGILPICSIHADYTVRLKKDGENIGCYGVSRLEPIPLTEEWLLKFGFEKNMAWTYSIDLGNLKLVYYLGEKGFSIGFKNYSDFSNLKYVHQLQNLYKALTNEELELK